MLETLYHALQIAQLDLDSHSLMLLCEGVAGGMLATVAIVVLPWNAKDWEKLAE